MEVIALALVIGNHSGYLLFVSYVNCDNRHKYLLEEPSVSVYFVGLICIVGYSFYRLKLLGLMKLIYFNVDFLYTACCGI